MLCDRNDDGQTASATRRRGKEAINDCIKLRFDRAAATRREIAGILPVHVRTQSGMKTYVWFFACWTATAKEPRGKSAEFDYIVEYSPDQSGASNASQTRVNRLNVILDCCAHNLHELLLLWTQTWVRVCPREYGHILTLTKSNAH